LKTNLEYRQWTKTFQDTFFIMKITISIFLKSCDQNKKKFNWTLQLIATVEKVPKKYFYYMTNSTGIFEIRVEVGSDIFRGLAFFTKET